MLEIVFDMYFKCFTTVYNGLNRIQIGNGISLWTWILCNFVGFGILAMLLRNFGISAVLDRTDSSFRKVDSSKSKNNSKSKEAKTK